MCGFAELLITAGGENVVPALIEDAIKRELPVVSNAIVIGDRKKLLSCLLTLKVNTFVMFTPIFAFKKIRNPSRQILVDIAI